MEAQATARYVRMGPRKVRFVLQTIKGKYAQDALDQLKFTPNYAADEVANVLRSAMANAENNHGMSLENLKIARAYVDVGPTAKRVQPRAQGRAYRILKRTSHITVVVTEGEAPPAKTGSLRKERLAPLRAALPVPAAPAEATAPAADETPVETLTDETTPLNTNELPTGTEQIEAATESAAGDNETAKAE